MRRVGAFGLALLICFCTISQVNASANDSQSPRATYLKTVYAGLNIDATTGIAYCQGYSIVHGGAYITLRLYLEQQEATGSWSTIKTWTSTCDVDQMLHGQYAVPKGYNYRLRTVCIVYNAHNAILEMGNAIATAYY